MANDKLKQIAEQFKEQNKSRYRDTGREIPNAIDEAKKGYDEGGFKEAALRGLSAAGEPIDSILGVPYRTLASRLAETSSANGNMSDYGQALLDTLKSVGTDPEAAPTGANIAEKLFPDPQDVVGRTAMATLYDTNDMGNLAGGIGIGAKMAAAGKIPLAGTIKNVGKMDEGFKALKGTGVGAQKLISGEERMKKLEALLNRPMERPMAKNPEALIDKNLQMFEGKGIQKATPIGKTEQGVIQDSNLTNQLKSQPENEDILRKLKLIRGQE